MIEVDATFMTHESGSKFYEVLTLTELSTRKVVTIRRWGKISVSSGGGETKVKAYSNPREAQLMTRTLLSQKLKRGYAVRISNYALHAKSGKPIDMPTLSTALLYHYGNNMGFANNVMKNFGLIDHGSDLLREAVAAPRAAEPDRSKMTDWGSW